MLIANLRDAAGLRPGTFGGILFVLTNGGVCSGYGTSGPVALEPWDALCKPVGVFDCPFDSTQLGRPQLVKPVSVCEVPTLKERARLY